MELTHAGPKRVNREAELRRPSGVVCSDMVRHRLVLPPAPPRFLPFEEADHEQTNSKHYGVHDEKADMFWFQES